MEIPSSDSQRSVAYGRLTRKKETIQSIPYTLIITLHLYFYHNGLMWVSLSSRSGSKSYLTPNVNACYIFIKPLCFEILEERNLKADSYEKYPQRVSLVSGIYSPSHHLVGHHRIVEVDISCRMEHLYTPIRMTDGQRKIQPKR